MQFAGGKSGKAAIIPAFGSFAPANDACSASADEQCLSLRCICCVMPITRFSICPFSAGLCCRSVRARGYAPLRVAAFRHVKFSILHVQFSIQPQCSSLPLSVIFPGSYPARSIPPCPGWARSSFSSCLAGPARRPRCTRFRGGGVRAPNRFLPSQSRGRWRPSD